MGDNHDVLEVICEMGDDLQAQSCHSLNGDDFDVQKVTWIKWAWIDISS